jgi:FkbM family methyltransferase
MNFDKLFTYIGKSNGVFIEAGANDGIFQSYTYPLEQEYGWTGVLVEPSVNAFNSCVHHRGRSQCINAALTNNPNIKELYGDFDGNPMSSIQGERLGRAPQFCVKALTLTQIFNEYFTNTQVDLMSIDVENYEYEVLSGLDYSKHSPTFILAEIYINKFNDVKELLEKNNYQYIDNITGYNYIDNPQWDGTHNDYLFKKL